MARLLILSDVNLPYRIEVFKGLSRCFETVTFFNGRKIEGSNSRWYCPSDDSFEFHVLDNCKALQVYNEALENISDFDLVLCYDPWHKRSRALQRLCIKKNVPYILNADGVVDINKKIIRKIVKSYYVKRAALCFAGCNKAVEYFKYYSADESKIVKHPFTSFFEKSILDAPYTEQQKAEIRQRLGLEDRVTFLSVGRFVLSKGFDLLLDAWGRTSQESQLVIVGGGPMEKELCDIVSQRGLKNVKIVGYVPQNELNNYYAAANAFVMPTRSDVWGLVINEAMSKALPIISSDKCTASVELIEQQKNGLLYSCCDVERLAECISTLELDTELMQRMGIDGLKAIREYTYENVIKSHTESIMSVVERVDIDTK